MSSLFREKNLQRISSPEQLNAYIRVSTPSVWMLLGAIVILLVGICVWGVFGRMDTKLSVVAVSENGTITAYTTVEIRTNGQYVESGYCKVQMKYAVAPTYEQMATFYITSVMRVESIPANLTE